MTEITKIALTGGPCAGKSSAVPYLTARLAAHGVEVIAVPEQATALMSSGKTPENMGSFAFHSLLFGNQLAAEEA
ncbi:MAG: AAA family ATPase, partial [Ruminococcus sp.]|nr:AAA family ATPase [Ruminococcus sp.]